MRIIIVGWAQQKKTPGQNPQKGKLLTGVPDLRFNAGPIRVIDNGRGEFHPWFNKMPQHAQSQ